MPRRVPATTRETILLLHENEPELTLRDIAKRVGLHHETVRGILHEAAHQAHGLDETPLWLSDVLQGLRDDIAALRGDVTAILQRSDENQARVLGSLVELHSQLIATVTQLTQGSKRD